METTDPPAVLLCREVRDRKGRVYRVGESAVDLMGRGRAWMVVLPWVGVTGVSCAAYAFIGAYGGPGASPPWGGGLSWLAGLWVFCGAAAAFPAGCLRESGRLPARTATVAGAFGTLAGCLALALAPEAPALRWGSAAVGGLGAGLVHATCLTLPGKWYPERRGGPTGFVASGLAFGAVPFLPVLGSWSDPGDRPLPAAVLGAAACVPVIVAGLLLRDPPGNWWPPHPDPLRVPADPVARRARDRNPPAVRQYGLEDAARTPVLWMTGLCLLLAVCVTVLGIVGLAPFGRAAALGDGTVSAAVTLTVAGGAGAGAAGALSDRLGRRVTLIAACLVLGTAQFGVLVAGRTGSAPLFLGCATAVGLGGGAVLPLVAAMSADHFGENRSASTYGLLASSLTLPLAVAALAGPVTGAGPAGAPTPHRVFALAGCVSLACAVLALFLKAPGRPSARRIVPNPHPLGEEMA